MQNWIKQHRLSQNLTQEDLARRAGVSRQSIISIERGRYVPSLPLALRLAHIFRCPVEDLFRLDDGEPETTDV
ncbi:helix-turn-helix transcriptional regulator [bacterium]|nr:helix-turn-helix transcriptional regulator [bacterium]